MDLHLRSIAAVCGGCSVQWWCLMEARRYSASDQWGVIAADWRALRAVRATLRDTQARLRSQVTKTLALGASGRGISRRTLIPVATVRRWADQTRADDPAGVA